MNFRHYNVVVLAEDYARLRDWYIATLGLELLQEWSDSYHYAELARDGRVLVGIADTSEMGVQPVRPRRNSVLMQLTTDDIEALFERVKGHGANAWGPKYSEEEDFGYGGFKDLEGNEIWVVQPGARDGKPAP